MPVVTPKGSYNNTSILYQNSPLMTSSNPFRKQAEPLKEDSCLKFVMK